MNCLCFLPYIWVIRYLTSQIFFGFINSQIFFFNGGAGGGLIITFITLMIYLGISVNACQI